MARVGERSENWKHGHSGNPARGVRPSPTYLSWCCMRQRCTNPADPFYARYGGRGIRVCERWRRFENFLVDMGERPAGTTLGRKDSDGDYEPANCQWETQRAQQRNRTNNLLVAFGGETRTLAEWCDRLNLNYHTVHDRLSRGGWDAQRALTTPTKKAPLAGCTR